jgi:hypothetical protein
MLRRQPSPNACWKNGKTYKNGVTHNRIRRVLPVRSDPANTDRYHPTDRGCPRVGRAERGISAKPIQPMKPRQMPSSGLRRASYVLPNWRLKFKVLPAVTMPWITYTFPLRKSVGSVPECIRRVRAHGSLSHQADEAKLGTKTGA